MNGKSESSSGDAVGPPSDDSGGGKRRPIKTRGALWARVIAGYLAAKKVRPNLISLASVVFSGLAGLVLITGAGAGGWRSSSYFAAAAIFIQARLLCNLFDGMVAVEGNRGSKSGEIFNDLPDRISDTIIFVCAGYAIDTDGWGHLAGFAAGLAALLVAYVRVLGASAGAGSIFVGPMAKQHRMALLTAACVGCALSGDIVFRKNILLATLATIVVGCVVTGFRRLAITIKNLEAG